MALPQRGNFTLAYETSIPRQAGLSGSSAIVCAALNCLLDFYGIANRCVGPLRPATHCLGLHCLDYAASVVLPIFFTYLT